MFDSDTEELLEPNIAGISKNKIIIEMKIELINVLSFDVAV